MPPGGDMSQRVPRHTRHSRPAPGITNTAGYPPAGGINRRRDAKNAEFVVAADTMLTRTYRHVAHCCDRLGHASTSDQTHRYIAQFATRN